MENKNYEQHGEEDNRWPESNRNYYEYVNELGMYYKNMIDKENMKVEDMPLSIIQNIGAYVGDSSLGQLLYRYELYKKVINLAGDIAEIGIFRGNTFLNWAKFVQIFEPYSHTQVYGFDWFKGMAPGKNDDSHQEGRYSADKEHLLNIIKWQKLEDIAIVEDMDVTKCLKEFVEERPYLRFKLLYIDCGIEEVMEASYKYLWPRLVKGGVLLMDHFNCSTSPTESGIIQKYIGNNIVRQMPFARQPAGYCIKEFD